MLRLLQGCTRPQSCHRSYRVLGSVYVHVMIALPRESSDLYPLKGVNGGHLHLLSSKDQSLLYGRNAFLLFNSLLDLGNL
jgi:hypothetical protein